MGTGWAPAPRPRTTSSSFHLKKALLYACAHKLKTVNKWRDLAIDRWPACQCASHPEKTYKHEGWRGYGHWLGSGNICSNGQQFMPFNKALLYASSLKLESAKDWQVWCKSGARPVNIPSTPQRTYQHGGWQGYGHWLGTL